MSSLDQICRPTEVDRDARRAKARQRAALGISGGGGSFKGGVLPPLFEYGRQFGYIGSNSKRSSE